MTDASSPDQIESALLGYLRDHVAAPSLDYAESPSPIFGGNRTFVYGFRLTDAPVAYSKPLILRVLRPSGDDASARVEAATQVALTDLGYPAPRVLAWSDSRDTFGGAFMIMERLAGRPLVLGDSSEEMTGRSIFLQLLPDLRRLLFGRWPGLLADVQVRLHGLHTESFLRKIESDGLPRNQFGMESALGRFATTIDEYSIEGLRPGLNWLRNNCPPATDRPSICHGDFFPNQVLAQNGAVTGVIDWSDVIVGPAELDVGIVKAGIETFPAPLGGLGLALQRRIARRYVSAYRRLHSLDSATLRYGEAFRCLRTLLEISIRHLGRANVIDLDPGPNPYDHPLAEANLISRFCTLAGVRVRP